MANQTFRVGKPRLLLRRSSDVVLAAGFQLVPWNDVVEDDVGGFDGASTYTFDRAGLFLFGCQIRRDAVASTSNVFPRALVDGVVEYPSPDINTTAAQARHFGGMLLVEAGQQLTIDVRLHTTLSATMTASSSWLWLTRVGPWRWT